MLICLVSICGWLIFKDFLNRLFVDFNNLESKEKNELSEYLGFSEYMGSSEYTESSEYIGLSECMGFSEYDCSSDWMEKV